MKKNSPKFKVLILPLIFMLFTTSFLQAQDLTVKQDKTNLEAKVVEITEEAVKYHRFDNLEGPVYSLKKAEIFMIIYKNGKTESFSTPENAVTSPATTTSPAPPTKPTYTPPVRNESVLGIENNAEKPEKTGQFIKNKSRVMLSPGLFKTFSELDFAAKAAYENVKPLGSLSGYGIAVNNFLDIYAHYSDEVTPANDEITITKHYLSGYVFKEFDSRFISAGFSGGIGFNHTRGSYYDGKNNETILASFNTVGLHTTQYLHKYTGKNKRGERSGFIRFGLDQYIMLEGSSVNSFHLAFGF